MLFPIARVSVRPQARPAVDYAVDSAVAGIRPQARPAVDIAVDMHFSHFIGFVSHQQYLLKGHSPVS